MLSSDVGGSQSHGVVTNHNVILKEAQTEPQNPKQNQRELDCGDKNEQATRVRGQRAEHEDLE